MTAGLECQVYALPLRARFRGTTVRRGVLLRGPAGWGEFCPFADYDDSDSVAWLAAAQEAADGRWPTPVRDRVPVNTTVPAVDPEDAAQLVATSGCTTAKVKVAEPGGTLAADTARVAAVREALGPDGAIRVDANGAWSVPEAVNVLAALDRAAGGLEYAEQPCATVDELARVRRRVPVRIAADESIRRADDPYRVARAEAADIAVLKVAPLGGVAAALTIAERIGLECVVSSAVETSVGLAAGIALAAALPELPFACGLGTAALLAADVVDPPLLPQNGTVPVLARSPAPDPELLAAARADAADQRWWTERLHRVRALLP